MAGILENGQVTIRFVAPTSIISNQPSFVQDTVSLKRQTNSRGVQRWEIKTNLEPSNSSADFLVHSITVGHNNIFNIQVPQVFRLKESDKTTTSGIVSLFTQGQLNSSTISITGNNGQISKGEFIKFGNHDKVYIVTETRNGNGNLEIYPPLRMVTNAGTSIAYGSSVTMKVRFDTDTVLGITYTDGILSDPGAVTFIEAI